MVKAFTSDIDIDVADRVEILHLITHIPAAQISETGEFKRHPSGMYATRVPYDGMKGMAAIDYKEAEQRGYVKIDLLNMSVYTLINSEEQYSRMLSLDVPWNRLAEKSFTEQLVHIGAWHSTIMALPEPITSIPRMAMFLSIIRPGKKHLVGRPWREIANTVWQKSNDGYFFKKSHAVAAAIMVSLHMNLLHYHEDDNDEL